MAAKQPKLSEFFSSSKTANQTGNQTASAVAPTSSSNSQASSVQSAKRKVVKSWFSDFKWLTHDSDQNKLFCSYCISAGRSNVFTKGKDVAFPKKDDIRKHEKSVDHKFAVCAQVSKESNEMPRAVSTAYRNIKESIIAVMRNVYFMAKEELPKEKISALNDHCLLQVISLKFS